jgi:hypothetical protein
LNFKRPSQVASNSDNPETTGKLALMEKPARAFHWLLLLHSKLSNEKSEMSAHIFKSQVCALKNVAKLENKFTFLFYNEQPIIDMQA